jgi:hypothetical protein
LVGLTVDDAVPRVVCAGDLSTGEKPGVPFRGEISGERGDLRQAT